MCLYPSVPLLSYFGVPDEGLLGYMVGLWGHLGWGEFGVPQEYFGVLDWNFWWSFGVPFGGNLDVF